MDVSLATSADNFISFLVLSITSGPDPKETSSGGTKLDWGPICCKIQNFQYFFLKLIKDLRNLSGGLCPHSALLGSAHASPGPSSLHFEALTNTYGKSTR
jgi:hypothetical protein